MTCAVEGDLDEVVLRRIAAFVGISIGVVHGRKGKPMLLAALNGYNKAAQFAPWICLVDLDLDCDCAPPCVQKWLPNQSAYMCFRIAVRTVEAWLLADRERIARWRRVSVGKVPQNPDSLANPKQFLVNLARYSHQRAIQDDLVPRQGSGRAVGPLYTARMIEFAGDEDNGWRPEQALQLSKSLARCINRIRILGDQE